MTKNAGNSTADILSTLPNEVGVLPELDINGHGQNAAVQTTPPLPPITPGLDPNMLMLQIEQYMETLEAQRGDQPPQEGFSLSPGQ